MARTKASDGLSSGFIFSPILGRLDAVRYRRPPSLNTCLASRKYRSLPWRRQKTFRYTLFTRRTKRVLPPFFCKTRTHSLSKISFQRWSTVLTPRRVLQSLVSIRHLFKIRSSFFFDSTFSLLLTVFFFFTTPPWFLNRISSDKELFSGKHSFEFSSRGRVFFFLYSEQKAC